MSDDIRDVLRAYAATTPDLDPRDGFAARLARHERRRRATIAAFACFAALVAGTGVAALSGDDASRIGLTDEPTPPVPTPTEEPSPTAEPTPTVTPDPTPTGSEEPGTADPTHDATPVADPGPPFHSDDGLTLRADLSPAGAPTATTVALRIRAEDDDGYIQVSRISWGDGTQESLPVAMHACPAPPSPAPTTRPLHPNTLDTTYPHAWRNDGTYTVTVEVKSETACLVPRGETERRTVRRQIVVSAGEIVSNGPSEPDPRYLRVEKSDRGYWTAGGRVFDSDGYLGALTIDWGDGSEPTVVEQQSPCDDGDGDHYPYSDHTIREPHTYEPGRYTVTFSWSSTGCDGKDEQSGQKTVAVDAR